MRLALLLNAAERAREPFLFPFAGFLSPSYVVDCAAFWGRSPVRGRKQAREGELERDRLKEGMGGGHGR